MAEKTVTIEFKYKGDLINKTREVSTELQGLNKITRTYVDGTLKTSKQTNIFRDALTSLCTRLIITKFLYVEVFGRMFNAVRDSIMGVVDYIQKGVEMNRQYELSMARLSVSTGKFDISIGKVSNDLKMMSIAFGVDLNTLINDLRSFTREGYSAAESEKLLFGAMRLGIANAEDFADAQNVVISAMEVFGLKASSIGYITEKLNSIVSSTNMSLGNINKILGGAALTIQNNRMSMDDFANAVYTLDQRGVSATRMIRGFDTLMKELSGTTLQVIGPVDSITKKFETISSTISFKKIQMDKLRELSQMDLTKGWDIGRYFDEKIWNRAIKAVENLKTKGITTLTELNEIRAQSSDYSKYRAQSGELYETDKLMTAILAYNEWTEEMNNANEAMGDFGLTAEETQQKIAESTKTIEDLTSELKGLPLKNDLHYISLGLENAAYSDKILDEATRNLVNSIRTQRDEIERLQRANEEYSLSSQKINISIMRIQLAGMSRRRGLTRSEEREIKRLQYTEMQYRIKAMENGMAIEEIRQSSLNDLETKLQETKWIYDEELRYIRFTYDQEVQALKDKIAAENAIIESYRVVTPAATTFPIVGSNGRYYLSGTTPEGGNTNIVVNAPINFSGTAGAELTSTLISSAIARGIRAGTINSNGTTKYSRR